MAKWPLVRINALALFNCVVNNIVDTYERAVLQKYKNAYIAIILNATTG